MKYFVGTGDRSQIQTYLDARKGYEYYNPTISFVQGVTADDYKKKAEKKEEDDGEEKAKKKAEGMNKLRQILDDGTDAVMAAVIEYAREILELKGIRLEDKVAFEMRFRAAAERLKSKINATIDKVQEDGIATIYGMPEDARDEAGDMLAKGTDSMASLIDTILSQIGNNMKDVWDYFTKDYSGIITTVNIIKVAVKGARSSIKTLFEGAKGDFLNSSPEGTKVVWQQKFYQTLLDGWDDAVAEIQRGFTASIAAQNGGEAGADKPRVIRLAFKDITEGFNLDTQTKKLVDDDSWTLDIFGQIKKDFEEIVSKTFDTFWVQKSQLKLTDGLVGKDTGPGPVELPVGDGAPLLTVDSGFLFSSTESGPLEIWSPAVIGLCPSGLGQGYDFGWGQGLNPLGQRIGGTGQLGQGLGWLRHIIGGFGEPFEPPRVSGETGKKEAGNPLTSTPPKKVTATGRK
jgi:hypothetical protein